MLEPVHSVFVHLVQQFAEGLVAPTDTIWGIATGGQKDQGILDWRWDAPGAAHRRRPVAHRVLESPVERGIMT